MPQYRLRASAKAVGLERAAAADSDQAKDANAHADNYMLAVVLFASALFFAGISTKMHTENGRRIVLGIGWLVFLGAAIWLATLPVQVTG